MATSRPITAAGEDATYISRIRKIRTVNGLVLWWLEYVRKGAALDAVQIAECLINRKLISTKKKAASKAARAVSAEEPDQMTQAGGYLSAQSDAEARRARVRRLALQQPLADGAVLFRSRQPRGADAGISA